MPVGRIFRKLDDLQNYFRATMKRSEEKMNWNNKIAKLVWDARQNEVDFLTNKILLMMEFLHYKDIPPEELDAFRQERQKNGR